MTLEVRGTPTVPDRSGAWPRLRLGVNIDHVATLRNARGGRYPEPLRAAEAAIAAGADGITAHLREDRRHITDSDIAQLSDLCQSLGVPLNFEMAVTAEMVEIALTRRPRAACLVPERREEITTEGGLNVAGAQDRTAAAVAALKTADIRVSLFVEASRHQIEASAEAGADVVELHTGAFCEAVRAGQADLADRALARLKAAAELAAELGLEVHAGHGIDYVTAGPVAAIAQIVELNIGHFLIGEAIFCGLERAIQRMRALMDAARRDPAARSP